MVMLTDTSVWIAHFRDQETVEVELLRRQLASRIVPIGDLVAMELLQGMSRGQAMSLERWLRFLDLHAMASPPVVLQSARNYRYLRERGYTVRSSIDCIIATYCIQEGHSLLHRDRDYEPFEAYLGLRVERA